MKRLVAVALFVPLAACSGGTPPSTNTGTTSCETPSVKLVEQIMSGAESDVGKLTARGSGAVKASGYKNVYFVAVEFTGAEFENDPNTGVWASNALDGSGVIMAVDPFAQIFTVFPDGDKTQAQIPQVGDDQSAAEACLR